MKLQQGRQAGEEAVKPPIVRLNESAKRALLIALEITLVLVILALVAAIWLPALVGAHPNATGR